MTDHMTIISHHTKTWNDPTDSGETNGQPIRAEFDVRSHDVEFRILKCYNGDEWSVEISGFVKWDGCINWHAGGDCAAHACGADGIAEILTVFLEVYDECCRLCPHSDGFCRKCEAGGNCKA